MDVLICLGLPIVGGIIGWAIAQVIFRRNTAYGYFVMDPVEDPDSPDAYTIGIKFNEPNLRDKDKIILYKMKSQ